MSHSLIDGIVNFEFGKIHILVIPPEYYFKVFRSLIQRLIVERGMRGVLVSLNRTYASYRKMLDLGQ